MKWTLREGVWLLENSNGRYIAILYPNGYVRYEGADGTPHEMQFDDASAEGMKMAVEMLV